MTIRDRIIAQLGCSNEEAICVELAARVLNRKEELRPPEELRPDEFAALIVRANITHKALGAAISDFLESGGGGRKS